MSQNYEQNLKDHSDVSSHILTVKLNVVFTVRIGHKGVCKNAHTLGVIYPCPSALVY